MKQDADHGGGDAMRVLLRSIGHHAPSSAYSWPASDELDADLRRAIAYRYGCVMVDDAFLVGTDGPVNLAQCEQTYSFVRSIIGTCIAAHGGRAKKSEREQVTRMVAQVLVRSATSLYGDRTSHIDSAIYGFAALGAKAVIPSADLRAPVGAMETSAGRAAAAIVKASCDEADAAFEFKDANAGSGPDIGATPQKNGRKPKVDVPYLQLVK